MSRRNNMATKYHLAPHGPDKCGVDASKPNSRGCPFGGESGKENHFDSMQEADDAYAKKMEESGNGTVANPVRAKGVAPIPNTDLASSLTSSYKKNFDQLASDSYYGISKHPRHGGYIADSSEALQRFCNKFSSNLDDEIEPEITYVEGSDDEVIQSVYVSELKIEIENQNAEDDMEQIREYQDNRWEADRLWRQ